MQKEIDKWEDYMVSTNGEVISKKRNKSLKADTTTGYCRVCLQKNNIKKWYLIHRLVAEAFIPNPENKPCVNHINGIKTDNRVSNLEWCTYAENSIHAVKNGLIKYQKYNERPNSKKIQQLHLITSELIKEFNSVAEASDITGLNRHHIANCGNNRRKSHGGFKWRYV